MSQNNKKNKVADISESEEEKLLDAIAKMTPEKFESFSRALLNRLGVEISNDGGIDGYGYHTDTNYLHTTRVVIQCKRYNAALVRYLKLILSPSKDGDF